MSSNETNPHYFIRIIYFNDHAIFIALDVEHNSIVFKNACNGIVCFYLSWPLPQSVFGFFVPSLKLLFAVFVLRPECAQCLFCYYSQDTNILKKFHKWELNKKITYNNRGFSSIASTHASNILNFANFNKSCFCPCPSKRMVALFSGTLPSNAMTCPRPKR